MAESPITVSLRHDPPTDRQLKALLLVSRPLANLVAVTLRHSSYAAEHTTDQAQARRLLREWQPDLVLIDIDHHDDLIDVIRGDDVRVPILAFTRRRDTSVKLRAFGRGADDIVEVPFTLDEIVARPYALLRRTQGTTAAMVPQIKIGGGLEVDLFAQTVKMNGGPRLDLTPIQQTLLYILAANSGEVLSREALLGTIWGADFQIESNVVDRHIRELRVKLGDDWRAPRHIETVPGKGYRFRPAPD
ncbi:MAG TPA: response regulator transcription factor [Candidatus Limnocylindria bacterium]|nr:response regulator transcription factor [Candidatus Limnocylindria bacterium]